MNIDTSKQPACDEIMVALYGESETGYKTAGHECINEADEALAVRKKSNLLYGEILPAGLQRALDDEHLKGSMAKVIYDIGMGTGKLAFRVFLERTNVERMVGIELSPSRFKIAEEKTLQLLELFPDQFKILEHKTNKKIRIMDTQGRRLEMLCESFFEETSRVKHGDAFLMNINVPETEKKRYYHFFKNMRFGARSLTYNNLNDFFAGMPKIVAQLEINKDSAVDRISTSWSVEIGHYFYMWERV